LAIQVRIATAIASALGAEISGEERRRIDRMPTQSADAYAHFLRARDSTRGARFAEAVRELDLAIAADRTFAEAYAQRAWLYAYGQIASTARSAFSLSPELRNADFQALALADAKTALDLYDGAALAWVARAMTDQFRLKYRDANDAFARALAVNPNEADALAEYATFESFRGNTEAAASLIERALRLDPYGPLTLGAAAQVALFAGRPQEALATAQKAVAIDPMNLSNNVLLVVLERDRTAAQRQLSATERLIDSSTYWALAGVAAGYKGLGLEAEARSALDRFAEWARAQDIGAGEWAQYYLFRGELNPAYEWLERAVEKLESGVVDAGFIQLQLMLNTRSQDPGLAAPRFQQLLDRLEALKSR